jgi:GGDEF domain-containing protein
MANDKQRSGPFRVFAGRASLPVLLGSLPVLAAVLWLGAGEAGWLPAATAVSCMCLYACAAIVVQRRAERCSEENRARLTKAVEARLAEFDLTVSVANRAFFESRLEQEIRRARRYSLSLAVVAIRLGGRRLDSEDEVRRLTGTVIVAAARLLRTEDLAGHIDGNQYAVCLPHTGLRGAAVASGRLRDAFRDCLPAFGFSVLAPGEKTTAQALLSRAFRDLEARYEAEVHGLNWNGAVDLV